MRLKQLIALIFAALLILTACGERDAGTDAESDKDSDTSTTEDARSDEQFADFKACMVSDSGGFDDKSFNQVSYQGLQDAKEFNGVKTAQAESSDASDYAPNLKSMLDAGCNSVTTVGFDLGDATLAAAKKNPDVDYSIVDFGYEDAPENLRGLTFNTAEPAFLAGYVAAASSESGIVGTFGGKNLPSVTIFMTGYSQGVDYYNEQNDAEVQVIGWDEEKQKGSFTNDFENKSVAQNTADELINQGADVIMPVLGPAGLGGLQAVEDAGVKGIWVDSDGCEMAAEYCDVLLTSVMKNMDLAVYESIISSAQDEFSNETYTGTLENGGVAIAELSDEVDSDVADEVEKLKQQIIDGEIKTG